VEKLGDCRAKGAVNELGPALFPLISRAEIRLTGSRWLPLDMIPKELRFREADRYEMAGVVDVITNIELKDQALASNRILQAILRSLTPPLPPRFEILVDYKGMRRPPSKPKAGETDYWSVYGWQLQTYASLRRVQKGALPVRGGVILYVNELVPTKGDLRRLRTEMAEGRADLVPAPGSVDRALLDAWSPKHDVPAFSLEYRLARALWPEPVTDQSIDTSLAAFDVIVGRIEVCRGREIRSGRVLDSWEKNTSDASTCTACDSRTFCPKYTGETRPTIPGVPD
jgi:hypothetical protein